MAGKTWKLPPLPQKPKFEAPKVDWQSGGLGVDVFYQMEGMEALQNNIDMLPQFYQDVAGREMTVIASEIIEEAREKYVPYRFGALRDSAGFDEYEPGKGIRVTEIGMWFGAPGSGLDEGSALAVHEGLSVKDPSVYAEDQHENLSYAHPVIGPVETPQAKYLEIPVLLKAPDVPQRIASAIDAAGGPNIMEGEGMEKYSL